MKQRKNKTDELKASRLEYIWDWILIMIVTCIILYGVFHGIFSGW